jgi:hypothetical protein
MNKRPHSITKIILLAALALAVCLGSSCAKKDTPKTPKAPEKKAGPATPAKSEAPKPAVKPAALTDTAKTEAPKAASPAPAAPAPQPTAAAAPGGAKMVPLNIELPKPMFVGTPTDIQVPNLEKPLGRARPPFLAPEGTVNLARGKPVKSSD